MLRGMVFVDYMNFNISFCNLYPGEKRPKLDYTKLFNGIVKMRPDTELLKTFIFAPKPDDFLMGDPYLSSYYNWLQKLNQIRYLDVVEGRYLARPTNTKEEMKIDDKTTYYKVEKGTDVNFATNALIKAYNNSYDVAFVVSGDSDYKPVYEQLRNMGKIVVLVTVKGQNALAIRDSVDDYIILNEKFFAKYSQLN